MSCFLFEQKTDCLKITAADEAGSIVTTIKGVEADKEYSFCLEAKMLLDSLKTLPEQPIIIDINESNNEVTVKYHGGKFQMMGKDASLFVQPKTITEPSAFSITTSSLLLGLSKTSFCVANDELRPIMNGVYIEIADGAVSYVATDGHKLAWLKCNDLSIQERAAFILPSKMAGVLKNILPNDETELTVEVNNSNVRFIFEAYSVIVRLIEGRYPNFRSVIPASNDLNVLINTISFKNALNRVQVFANASSRLVKLNLDSKKLVLIGQDIDYSTNAEETVECDSSDSITIGFKVDYLLDLISVISSDDVRLTFSDSTKASLILPSRNEAGTEFLCLLMPVMIND